MDGFAGDHESAVAAVVEGFGVLLGCIDPGLDDLEDEEIVFIRHPRVDKPAFEARVAFIDQRGFHGSGGRWGEVEFLELIHVAPGMVSAAHDRRRQVQGGNIDDAFLGRAQHPEGMVPVAEHTADQGRLKFHHRVPGHGHDIRPALVGRRHQHDGPRLQKAVNPR